LHFLYGPKGDNGKSTLAETWRALFGDYGLKTRAELFMRNKYGGENSGPTPERLALRGARLVEASELSDRQQFDEGFIKDVTGGIDRISARGLHKDPVAFRPELHLVLYGNHKPQLRNDDDAVWQRLRLIPFNVRIPRDRQDPELSRKLVAELPGILNWALAGLAEWRKKKQLLPPPEVLTAGQTYRDEMDTIGRFLQECTIKVAGATVKSKVLYDAYVKWAVENGIHAAYSNPVFSQKLVGRLRSRPLHGRTLWCDVGLRNDD
jgi:putative DNA primase/helicase